MSWQDKIIDAGVALREQQAEIAKVRARLEEFETEHRLAQAAFAELVRGQQTAEVDPDCPRRTVAPQPRPSSTVHSAGIHGKRNGTIKERLYQILNALEGSEHWKALAKQVGGSPKSVQISLYELKADGRIRSPARGYDELARSSQVNAVNGRKSSAHKKPRKAPQMSNATPPPFQGRKAPGKGEHKSAGRPQPTAADRLLGALGSEPQHWKQLVDEAGLLHSTTYQTLLALGAKGRVVSPTPGHYALAPTPAPMAPQPLESPSAPPPESPLTDSGRRVLRILEEAQRPVSIRTLAVASTLPREAVVAVLDRLQRAGKVTLDREQASAVSVPGVPQSPRPQVLRPIPSWSAATGSRYDEPWVRRDRFRGATPRAILGSINGGSDDL
ncbi:MAG: hypothetical protein H6716_28985 [Polyangiaceae bacterium]|nr:hypothetical protein [Polyangiaceae bacterium]